MGLTVGESVAGLLVLLLATLPLGAVLLRLLERWLGRRLGLSPPERVLAALYAAGGLLFVLASIPWPIFGTPLLLGLFALGAVGLLLAWRADGWRPARCLLAWLASPPGFVLTAGTFGLLLLEVGSIGTRDFPNSFDGSWQSLTILLLSQRHTLPWTLQPYADSGVIYPGGASVWMGVPVILFGWAPTAGPVVVPPFFLALSVVGAFCWGERLGGSGSPRGTRTGLLFAGFFGLVASWPRLFAGGSYDFALCLPLLLAIFGWLPGWVRSRTPRWRDVIAFGLLFGVCASLSALVAELLFFLLLGYLLVAVLAQQANFARWAAGLAVVLILGLTFVVRSLAGIAVWYSYPGHVLSAAGTPPYALETVGPAAPDVSLNGDLNPFVPWKWKLSPLPILTVELGLLLSVGLVILLAWGALPKTALRRVLPRGLVEPIVVTTVITFLFTAALALWILSGGPGASTVAEVTNVDEGSFALFIAYQSIALLPLVAVVEHLAAERRVAPPPTGPSVAVESRPISPRWTPDGRRSRGIAYLAMAAAVVLAFGVGAGVTVTEVPTFLENHLDELANVTAGDVGALDWAGAHLTSCARVLASPLSAAMFLPLYSSAKLIFGTAPLSSNLSYERIVANLTAGTYSTTVAGLMLGLGITQVFVTGATSVSFPPFDPAPLLGSSDFSLLYQNGDAMIFLFGPGASASGCEPV